MSRPAHHVLEMDLPIIADLGDGWFLVAHPNGPAISDAYSITVLYTESLETAKAKRAEELWRDDDDEPFSPPEEIRAQAVREFIDYCWPKVRESLFEGDPNDVLNIGKERHADRKRRTPRARLRAQPDRP